MRDIFFGELTLLRGERVRILAFLYGNGADANDLLYLVGHRLRDKSAFLHVKSTIQYMQTEEGKKKLYYYDTNICDVRKLCGDPHGAAVCSFKRKLHSFNEYVSRQRVSIAHQNAFFASESEDAFFFYRFGV